MARPSRRAFLAGAATSLLAGCTMDPSSSWWRWWTWAEGAWSAALQAGPLAGAKAKLYPRSAVTDTFPIRSLVVPDDYAGKLTSWKLDVSGLVDHPLSVDRQGLMAKFPLVAEITRHDCVEGWSAIAEWGGLRLVDLIDAVSPRPEARYVVFHSADADDAGTPYYGSLTLAQARHPQTLLAYEMNGRPLPVEHGAPLRLKVPTQLGYKSTKFIWRITFVASLDGLGGGKGGYWEDQGYEHYAGV